MKAPLVLLTFLVLVFVSSSGYLGYLYLEEKNKPPVEVEVVKEVEVEVPVEVIKEVEVVKEVPVDVIKEVEVVKEVEVRKRLTPLQSRMLLRGTQSNWPIYADSEDYLRDVVSIQPDVFVDVSDEHLKKLPIDKEALQTKMELILRKNNIPLYGGEGLYDLMDFSINGLVDTRDFRSAGKSHSLIFSYVLALRGGTTTYNEGIARVFFSDIWTEGHVGIAGEDVYEDALNDYLEEATEKFALAFLKAKSRKLTEEEEIGRWRYEKTLDSSLSYEQQMDTFLNVDEKPSIFEKEEE